MVVKSEIRGPTYWNSCKSKIGGYRCIADSDLSRNRTNYKDNHKHRDAMEIIFHFINVKYWNMLIDRNGNKPARVMVAYLWEEMWRLHASELCYNDLEGLFIVEKQWKTLNIQKPNPRRWNSKLRASFWVNWYINFPGCNFGTWSPFDTYNSLSERSIRPLQILEEKH